MKAWLLCSSLAIAAPAAMADELSLHGYVDLRATSGGNETSWTEGGFGKLRGSRDGDVRIAAALVDLGWRPSPTLVARADVAFESADRERVALTEAWLRWRPVSTTPWRHALTVGLFYPPFGGAQDGLGWSNRHTLTPSVIDSWIGEELRIAGAQWRAERRGERGIVGLTVGAFGGNDPTGEVLANRGWSLSDVVSGVGSEVREPDALERRFGERVPYRYDPFLEIDHRVGVYAMIDGRIDGIAGIGLSRYDNRADPSRHSGGEEPVFAWRTRFTLLTADADFERVRVVVEAIDGDTTVAPFPGFRPTTEFSALALLVGGNQGEWRPAARIEAFRQQRHPPGDPDSGEHGAALTLALNWRPTPHWRLTAELIGIRSRHDLRVLDGESPQQNDVQGTMNLRWSF